MCGKIFRLVAVSVGPIVMLGAFRELQAQETKTAYASMAPVEKYMIGDRDAEIAMARSAAPDRFLAGSPVLGFKDKENGFTLYLIPAGKWSDGTAAEDH